MPHAFAPVQSSHRRRGVAIDLLLLAILTALLYLPGLDAHGVTNWQEAQRLIVARDMQARWHAGEGIAALVVPTREGTPYLAKPPFMYWAQLALAEPFGARVDLWHIRLAVALGGIGGVLAAYLAARALFNSRSIAWWSAGLLATGILSTRSARIGELDVFLMPFCTLAITAVALAWRHAREHRRTHWPLVLTAAACTTLAVLTKDPAVMIVGFGGFAAMVLYHAAQPSTRPTSPIASTLARVVLPMIAGTAAAIATLTSARSIGDGLGAAIVGVASALLVRSLLPVLDPARFVSLVRDLSRTHPLIVLGVPVAIRFGWAAWVDRLTGRSASTASAAVEVEDNLRIFVAEAPLNNLEAALYGVGLGSIAALAVAIWWVRARPRLTPAAAHLIAWIGLGLLAFSVLGKGVPRYLTPIWPAIAIVGGLGVHHLLLHARRSLAAPWLKTALAAGIVALGLGQTAWYAVGRELSPASRARSPRDFVRDLLPRLSPRDQRWIFSFEFATPALDYYVGRRVRALGDPGANIGMVGGIPWRVEQLHTFMSHPDRRGRDAIILVREGDAAERLRAAGLTLEVIPVAPEFRIDSGRRRVMAFRASAPPRAAHRSPVTDPPPPDADDDESP